MGFIASTSAWRTRMMPFAAILLYELRALGASWLVRLWLPATALLVLMLAGANWNEQKTAPLIATLLFPYLVFPWPLMVMVLSVSLSSGWRQEIADGLLSRSVTRYEYLLASWTARVAVVLGVYLAVIVPAVCMAAFAQRSAPADVVTLYGTVGALGVVALVQTFLVSMGFLFATLLRHQLVALAVLAVLWFPVNGVLNTFRLEEFSPISLTQALPTLLRQGWNQPDPDQADREPDLQAMARGVGGLVSFLEGEPVQATPPEPDFFDSDFFEDFSLSRVILGYGIPTLAAVALAVACFSWRDL